MTISNVDMKLPFNFLVLDSEGRLLHLGLPPEDKENKSLGGDIFHEKNYENWKDTHAFIVKSGSFQLGGSEKIENCQFIITRIKASENSTGHDDLHKMFTQRGVPNLENEGIKFEFDHDPKSKPHNDYLYSGECHATVPLSDLKEMAANPEPQILQGIQFMLQGTKTTALYRRFPEDNGAPKDPIKISTLINLTEYSAKYEDKEIGALPDLKTHIPIGLITLHRRYWDAGIRIVSSPSQSGIDESRLDSVKNVAKKFTFFTDPNENKNSGPLKPTNDNNNSPKQEL